jgi:hypothetical protein
MPRIVLGWCCIGVQPETLHDGPGTFKLCCATFEVRMVRAMLVGNGGAGELQALL